MIFKGYSKTFSTLNNKQYDLIGSFWDEMSLKFGMENLRGLGLNWTNTSIEYIIGFKNNTSFNNDDLSWKKIELPDDGWEVAKGKTDNLPKIYEDIYKNSNLKYEIEMFNNDGSCKIMYIRDN